MGLRELRDEQVLSQQNLAVRSGVSKTTIVQVEAGRIRPHPSTVRQVAAASRCNDSLQPAPQPRLASPIRARADELAGVEPQSLSDGALREVGHLADVLQRLIRN